MSLFFFRKNPVDYTDGELDLIPVPVPRADPFLQFGNERIWRICLHGSKKEIGQISYRDGESRCVFYYGHIGYHIDPPWRGHHYAYRACRLIREEIFRSGKHSAVITCDPDNAPSRKTCEKLGCLYEGTVNVPEDITRKYDISRVKCRYIWQIVRDGGNDAD